MATRYDSSVTPAFVFLLSSISTIYTLFTPSLFVSIPSEDTILSFRLAFHTPGDHLHSMMGIFNAVISCHFTCFFRLFRAVAFFSMNDGYGLEPSDPYYLIEVFQTSPRMSFRNGTIHDRPCSHRWRRDTHDTHHQQPFAGYFQFWSDNRFPYDTRVQHNETKKGACFFLFIYLLAIMGTVGLGSVIGSGQICNARRCGTLENDFHMLGWGRGTRPKILGRRGGLSRITCP